jgi:pimeloyl-ACP methyl ester carboxylesterase
VDKNGFAWLVFIAAALAFALAGCGSSDAPPTVPEGARPGDLTLEPCPFETKAGEFDADCGTLVVPENRARADSRLIALPVVRVHATGEHPAEPIFFLDGGPGSSNMNGRPPAELLAGHDWVLVGYRGVDGSAVLDCPEVSGAVRGVGGDVLSRESLAAIGAAYRQCALRLQDAGVDLDGYTIPEVVADLEAARAGLGYERLNLASHSYGTRLAQVYAYLHPERVHRSAMIGANPPGRFVWEPDVVDAQLAQYARLCAQDAGCRARTPDLAQTMRNVAGDMPRRWLLLPIDPGKVKVTTFAMLFNRDSAALVFDAYLSAEQGDPSGLALMSLAYDLIMPSFATWGEFVAKAVSADYDPGRDYIAGMNPPASILGAPMSLLFWGPARDAGWPTAPIPDPLRQVQPSAVETLLVSGSIDFSTPAQYASEELLPHLSHGQAIILAEMGHVNDVWQVQPEATVRLLTSFYATGEADDSLFTYAPIAFDVSPGFPTIAKLALGLLLVVIVAVVALVWFTVRWLRGRKAIRLSANPGSL